MKWRNCFTNLIVLLLFIGINSQIDDFHSKDGFLADLVSQTDLAADDESADINRTFEQIVTKKG